MPVMQRAVNTLTERIFPGVTVFKPDGVSEGLLLPNVGPNTSREQELPQNPQCQQQQQPQRLQVELVSNLPLQMALYFNLFYFPCWLVVSIVMLHLKYDHLHPLYRIILIAVLVVVTIVEVVRLYLGYLGNLSEMIPELAGFWLLTLMLQLPLQAFLLLNGHMIILPLERATNIIMTSFVLIELGVGYSAIRQVSEQLTNKFQLELLELSPNEQQRYQPDS